MKVQAVYRDYPGKNGDSVSKCESVHLTAECAVDLDVSTAFEERQAVKWDDLTAEEQLVAEHKSDMITALGRADDAEFVQELGRGAGFSTGTPQSWHDWIAGQFGQFMKRRKESQNFRESKQ